MDEAAVALNTSVGSTKISTKIAQNSHRERPFVSRSENRRHGPCKARGGLPLFPGWSLPLPTSGMVSTGSWAPPIRRGAYIVPP
jgi:hypothetical protein